MTSFFNFLDFCLFIVFLYLAWSVAYFFLFSIASHIKNTKPAIKKEKNHKMAILIPAYKEDAVIVHVANHAITQNYPRELYDVVVIADSLLPETISQLKELPVRVVEVTFKKSTKAKALNWCMEEIGDNYDIAVILDADNEMSSNFLHKINDAFNSGFLVVQGHRTAKNMNNSYAILDAISEEINNSIFRKGHRNLGLSSALIGSGMAVDYALYKSSMQKVSSVGEDKELELLLLERGYKFEYLPDALVYDEKIQNAEVLQKQRSRWIFAQLHFLKSNFIKSFKQLRKGNIDFFDKVIQQALPPRSILIGISGIVLLSYLISIFIPYGIFENYNFIISFKLWFLLLIFFVLALLLAIPSKLITGKTFKALYVLPRGISAMIFSLFKFRNAGKTFTHTPHNFNKKNIPASK